MAGDPLTDGFMAGQHMARGRALNSAWNDLAQANATIRYAQGVINSYAQEVTDLRQEVADLKLALKVANATEEADNALLAEWKATHPQSPLRQVVGKKRDGSPMLKATAIWIAKFDAVARKLGITNPEAHRIS